MGLLDAIRSGVTNTFQATDRETRTVFSRFTLAAVGLISAIILMQFSLPVTTYQLNSIATFGDLLVQHLDTLPVTTWLIILLPTYSLLTASFSLKLFAPTVSDTPLNEVRS
ncbi:uncharacterized BrkB/YihY/UPF0761 family membrane protein [Loktanella ponticola]|uniref:Uncharacterized BrkB/YihY/UPF0761 family membrane protein n=1 Tax=Yoonia ponticola TaxID=1524255 RepID=A0A7W9BKV0_9RHOB|nr:hypothetical protein [Yoonia ponticola]MBB5722391.1 uncharacterized BrkB/YihY/UPF0761 family membrane protein [Yoonia ponticola]